MAGEAGAAGGCCSGAAALGAPPAGDSAADGAGSGACSAGAAGGCCSGAVALEAPPAGGSAADGAGSGACSVAGGAEAAGGCCSDAVALGAPPAGDSAADGAGPAVPGDAGGASSSAAMAWVEVSTCWVAKRLPGKRACATVNATSGVSDDESGIPWFMSSSSGAPAPRRIISPSWRAAWAHTLYFTTSAALEAATPASRA